ncbi:MAG: polyprenyl synthetase family protein [Candidatus Lokiarchaeota archaeon]|nr:polyprenyl synthetase family protein [Candidatus Lokiarchaeota archaeon]
MKFTEYSKEYIPKINDAITLIYDRKLKSVENPFLKDYYSELKDYFLSGGKRIRPLLCIATFNAFTKNQDDKIVLPSIGVEFVHNASLIHDDIIDKDNFRRGKPAFHFRFRNYYQQYNLKKMIDVDFGNSIGIIGGDSAFFLGLESYLFNEFEKDLNLKAINYYEQAFIEIANGVLIEIDMVNQKNLTMSDYIKMISLKTGALIEKSILIGANYAKVNEDSLKDLSIYGINLGIIFQIIDDILGTFGDEKVTGKPTDGDIREGKKTCLLIEALNKLEDNEKNKLEELIEKPDMTIDDVQEVKDLYLKADVINSCKDLANSYFKEAKLSLDRLSRVINQPEMELFENLLDFVIERKF